MYRAPFCSSVLKTSSFALVCLAGLMTLNAQAQTISVNSGSLGSAGNGVNTDGVTFTEPGPLLAPGDLAAGYASGTFSSTSVPYNDALNPAAASPFTIEFWARPSQLITDAPGPAPVFNRISSDPRSGWVFFQRSPGTGWNFRMYNGIGSTLGFDLTGGTADVDSWSHVVAVWNGSSASLYVNGMLADDTNDPAASGTYVSNVGPFTPLFTVGTYDDGTSNPFNGLIDEVAFYGAALNASQIAQHYSTATTDATVGAYSSLILSDGAVEYLQNVPEPASISLLGMAGCLILSRRRRARA